MFHDRRCCTRPIALAACIVGAAAGAMTATAAAPSASWLATAGSTIAREEYQLSLHDGGEGFTAPNRAQGLRARWHDGVLVVTPRIDGEAWSFRYELAGRSQSGRTLAELRATGDDYVVASNTALPFRTGSVDGVVTNSVPIDAPSILGPGVQSTEVLRILSPTGQWIRDGAVVVRP